MKKKSILVLSLIITALILIAGCTSTTPTTGIIDVNSTPTGAKVYLDGVDTGQVTPIILTNIEAGSHIVKLDKFHYKIWEDTAVTVNVNQTTYLNPPLTYVSTQYITLQPGPEGIDSPVESNNPTTNYGNSTGCAVGNTATNIIRTYIKFDLSTIPANAIVVDADLKLYQWGTLGTDNFTIGLYKVTSDWDESIIDWDPQPTCSFDAEITSEISWGTTPTWRSWDIDTLAQAWLDGSITNYGVVLKDTNEASVDMLAYFLTSDYATDTKRPKLEIDYYIP